jgi:streptomycin 6-kinase
MIFNQYLAHWKLVADGDPIITRSSRLLPVMRGDEPAMLKVAVEPEEKRGANLMKWWNGEGAASVLAQAGDALLLERASGDRSLVDMARDGDDDEASRIICAVATRLHAPRADRPSELTPLSEWFAALEPAAVRHGGILRLAASTARELLADPRDITVLHGDIHHGNVLDFGPRGWLAIDPKGLIGECGYDFANMFNNPDSNVAAAPGRLARQATVVAGAADLDRSRLVRWVVAYSGLSAAWFLADGDEAAATLPMTIAGIAVAELGP